MSYEQETLALMAESLSLPNGTAEGRSLLDKSFPNNILCFRHTGLDGLAPQLANFQYCHHRCVLIYALKGNGIIAIDREYHFIEPGEAYLILPHQVHFFPSLDEDCEWIFITFEQDSKNLLALKDEIKQPNNAAMNWLEQAIACYQHSESTPLLIHFVSQLLTELLNSDSIETRIPDHWAELLSFKEKIDDYVHDNITGDLSIKTLAKIVDLSTNYFNSHFKRLFSISPGQYVRLQKIAFATELLKTTDSSIEQIAVDAGFESTAAFVRTFRMIMGKPPGKYRQTFL